MAGARWTDIEDRALEDGVRMYGYRWALIAYTHRDSLVNRTKGTMLRKRAVRIRDTRIKLGQPLGVFETLINNERNSTKHHISNACIRTDRYTNHPVTKACTQVTTACIHVGRSNDAIKDYVNRCVDTLLNVVYDVFTKDPNIVLSQYIQSNRFQSEVDDIVGGRVPLAENVGSAILFKFVSHVLRIRSASLISPYDSIGEMIRSGLSILDVNPIWSIEPTLLVYVACNTMVERAQTYSYSVSMQSLQWGMNYREFLVKYITFVLLPRHRRGSASSQEDVAALGLIAETFEFFNDEEGLRLAVLCGYNSLDPIYYDMVVMNTSLLGGRYIYATIPV